MPTIARNSIRDPQSVARLSRTFSKSLTAVDLAEPLLSLDENQTAEAGAGLLQTCKLTVLGVRRAGLIAGWVALDDLRDGTLGEHIREFAREEVLDESSSHDAVLRVLATLNQVFIEWLGEVTAVITRRDLQKPPLRMWLFGAITVFDTNLTWAIEQLYPDDTWCSHISAGRLAKATALLAERQRCGAECRLIECLQIKDKADILVSDGAHLEVLGLTSRREADRLTRDIEKLRNHLAHAQELEPEHLATAARLAALINSILGAEGVRRIVALPRHHVNPPIANS